MLCQKDMDIIPLDGEERDMPRLVTHYDQRILYPHTGEERDMPRRGLLMDIIPLDGEERDMPRRGLLKSKVMFHREVGPTVPLRVRAVELLDQEGYSALLVALFIEPCRVFSRVDYTVRVVGPKLEKIRDILKLEKIRDDILLM